MGKTTMSLAKDLESQEDAWEDIVFPPSELWVMSHPWKSDLQQMQLLIDCLNCWWHDPE